MDVHPPLYYILLKLLFTITFISHANPYVQVIVGRAFSVLIYIITLLVLQRVLYKVTKQKFPYSYLLLTCLFPTVIWHTTGIRMYSLSALLIACELNAIISFNQNHHIKDIVWITLFAALSAWTHYYAAIIAGLFLLYNFITEKKFRWYYLESGIAYVILFLPWLMVALKQTLSVKKGYWIRNNISEYLNVFSYQEFSNLLGDQVSCIFAILFLICLLYITLVTINQLSSEFRKYYKMVSIILFGTILLGLVLSLLIRPIFQARYVYGISLIYFAMTLPLIKKFASLNRNTLFKVCFGVLICSGVLFNLCLGGFNLIKDFKVYKNVQRIEQVKSDKIRCSQDAVSVVLMDSFYAKNKVFVTKNYNKLYSTCQSIKLFKTLYPNIKD